MFFSGFIVGVCGFDFVGEVADVELFAIFFNFDPPFAEFVYVRNAKVFRRRIFAFFSVAGILSVSRKAQIGQAVVEGIAVLMVNKQAWRGVYY